MSYGGRGHVPRLPVHPRERGDDTKRRGSRMTSRSIHLRLRAMFMPPHLVTGPFPYARVFVCRTDCDRQVRFILTSAGDIRTCFQTTTRSSVHPRICGRSIPSVVAIVPNCGSFTRVRVPSSRFAGMFDCSRFIPACVRDRLHYRQRDVGIPWLIPVYVGDLHTMNERGRDRPVHPRDCGEYTVTQRTDSHPYLKMMVDP